MKKVKIIIPCIVLAVVVVLAVIAKASPAANAFIAYNVLGKNEINDIFITKTASGDTYLSKPVSEIKDKSINWMTDRMSFINDEYLSDSNVYYSIIPDKAYYLSKEDEKVPSVDYGEFENALGKGVNGFAKYIDIKDLLSVSDYYMTDSHWKQECIVDVASYLLEAMEGETAHIPEGIFEEDTFLPDYTGVYYDRVNLSLNKDTLKYLKGDYIDGLKVFCLDTGNPKEIGVYDFDVVPKENYYEFFLYGSKSLITIENPAAASDMELIVFRDSFGCSIAPLLASGYSKVTFVDIRYISPARLGTIIDFSGKDVLFLYSAAVINTSAGQIMK